MFSLFLILGAISILIRIFTSAEYLKSRGESPSHIEISKIPYRWLGPDDPKKTKGFSICGIQPGNKLSAIHADLTSLPVHVEISKIDSNLIEEVDAIFDIPSVAIEYCGVVKFNLHGEISTICKTLKIDHIIPTLDNPVTIEWRGQRLAIYRKFVPDTDKISHVSLINSP